MMPLMVRTARSSMSQDTKWERRESKRESKKQFVSDNRVSVRGIINILKDKATKLKLKRG